MERKEFKQRLKGLLAWALVMILMVNSVPGGFVSVHAEGTEGATGTEGTTGTEGDTGTEGSTENMVNFPVSYYDGLYTDDGTYEQIVIKDKASAGEGEAYFISTDYTTDVTVDADATSILGVVLPQVEKDGYFFMNWELETTGTYDETAQEVVLGDGWTAGDLVDLGGLSFIAYFEKALTNNIIYDFTGATMDGKEDTYSYFVTQPDINTTEFEEPVITLVPVQDGQIFTGWQMDVGYQSWYDEETGMIHGSFEDGAESILYANWRDENTICVTYMISPDYEGIGSINAEESKVTYYESQTPAPVKTVSPEVTVTEAGWFFEGWYCPEVADMPQTTFELFYPECEVGEDGTTLIGGQNINYTMYAQFVPAREIIVSFDAGNGEEPVQDTIVQSSLEQETVTITLPEAPVYENYAFTGWYCENTDTVYPAGTEVELDIYQEFAGFYAQWERELPFSYNTYGGTITSTEYTTSVTLPLDACEAENVVLPVVEKDGYLFIGWELGLSSGGTYEAGTQNLKWDTSEPADTLTVIPLTALWKEANTINVTVAIAEGFDNAADLDWISAGIAGTYRQSKPGERASIWLLPTDGMLTNYGYLFVGWKIYDETGAERTDLSSAYVIDRYGTGIDCYPEETVWLDYPVDEDGTGGKTTSYVIEAQYVEADSIQVTTDLNDGTEGAVTTNTNYRRSFLDDTINFTLSSPYRANHEFVGWLCDYDNIVYDAGTNMRYELDVKEVTFTAQWEKVLPVTFETSGGQIISSEYTTSVTLPLDACEVENVVLPEVEKDGYFFVGWELGLSSGGTYEAGTRNLKWDTSEPADTLTEIPLTAVWQEPAVSTITYDLAGGTLNGTTEPHIVTMVQPTINTNSYQTGVIQEVPTKEGYIFTDWMMQQDEGGHGSYENGVITGHWIYQESYTMVAQWRPENTITITPTLAEGFEDAGTIDSAMGGTYGESTDNDGNGSCVVALTEVKDINKEYLFAGWKLYEASGAAVIMDGYVDIEDYDGTVISCYPVGTSLYITYPADGYNVGGNNATYVLEAQFKEAATVNIIFDLDGGSSDIPTSDIAYQKVIGEKAAWLVIPEAPVKDGYAFIGWSLDNVTYAPGETIGVDPTLEEVTFVAEWGEEEKVLPLTYVLNGGSITSEEYTTEVALSATATSAEVHLPEAVREGYFFDGWNLKYNEDIYFEAGAQNLVWNGSSPAYTLEELELTARWTEIKKIDVTYDLNGGTGLESLSDTFYQSAIDETTANLLLPETIPTKEGYDFAGWLCNMNNGIYKAGAIVKCAFDQQAVKFTAQWEETEFTIDVTYDTDGGKITSTDYTQTVQLLAMANTAEVVELPSVEKDGYFFKYWKLTNNETEEYQAGTQYLTWSEDEPAYLLKGLTLKAYWQEALKSIITYDLDGGVWSEGQESVTQTFTQPDSNTASFGEGAVADTPKKSGFAFIGWTMDETDTSSYNQETHLISGLYGTNYMLKALWEAIISTGTISLQSGTQYRLDEGSWTVDGDTTVYAGGNYFYVSEDGDYTFTAK